MRPKMEGGGGGGGGQPMSETGGKRPPLWAPSLELALTVVAAVGREHKLVTVQCHRAHPLRRAESECRSERERGGGREGGRQRENRAATDGQREREREHRAATDGQRERESI
eukprot:SAG11_NODE_4655_length_1818_cov_1.430814_2_plen_111_part_01